MDFDSGSDRPGCLTIYLVVAIILNGLVALFLLAFGSFREDLTLLMSSQDPLKQFSSPVLIGLGLVGLVTVVCLKATFEWKKWGPIGVVVAALAGVALGTLAVPSASGAGGLLGLMLFGFLIRPCWQRFR